MIPDDFQYCPCCATPIAHETRFGRLRPVCPACGYIHFEDPKVAAGALVEQGGSLLFVRRNNEPGRGLWSLPSGFVDAGEDPRRAAERECREETGLEVHVTGLVDILYGREHRRGADFVLYYRAEVVGGELAPGDDAEEACFFPLDAPPPLAFAATRQVLETLRSGGSPGVLK